MTTGERIEQLAKERGMSLHKLATLAGVSYNTVYSAAKRKSNRIDMNTLERLASVLQVSVAELYWGEYAHEFTQKAMREAEAYERELEEYYLPGYTKGLVAAFCKLNEEGQRKAIERVEELTQIAKYLADDTE